MNLLVSPATSKHVAQFMAQPGHALILLGPDGIGKTTLAKMIASQVLGLHPEKLEQYPYFSFVTSDTGSLSIEAIRELQKFLQLKTIGNGAPRRAIIVEHAEQLTVEAQNAFLKVLEEPPSDTIVLLTASNPRLLLPTILSRLQSIVVSAPEEAVIKDYFASEAKNTAALNSAYFLSGGLPGLMKALLSEDASHPLARGVADAKQVLQKKQFERLAMVDNLSKKRDQASALLEALVHIASTALDQAAVKGEAAKVKQWHHILRTAYGAQKALAQSANSKLVLTHFMLQL